MEEPTAGVRVEIYINLMEQGLPGQRHHEPMIQTVLLYNI